MPAPRKKLEKYVGWLSFSAPIKHAVLLVPTQLHPQYRFKPLVLGSLVQVSQVATRGNLEKMLRLQYYTNFSLVKGYDTRNISMQPSCKLGIHVDVTHPFTGLVRANFQQCWAVMMKLHGLC